ncbi:MAG: ATP-binding cassette domain-containing protein [Acidobacteria bacterium]|nr:ATP-binding cassette domain-containing protein [Acidobacteriota bacterium]MBV9478092.1 ATP-binding cassette domain-containing protein [Acidobacteriota bacterium]
MSIVLRDVVLPLAPFTLDVSFATTRRITALYGPSGAGKTSLLETIAGLRTPATGRIELNERVVFDAAQRVFVPPRARRVGYVPQDDALFPHLSVRQNVSYGATRDGDDDVFAFAHVVDVLELEPLLGRGVAHLSGGERKRVALARALLSRPEVLLLDEPLAGVDVVLRDRVLEYLVRVRDAFPIPMLYVTHQREEVAAICEELVLLDRGRVVDQSSGIV